MPLKLFVCLLIVRKITYNKAKRMQKLGYLQIRMKLIKFLIGLIDLTHD